MLKESLGLEGKAAIVTGGGSEGEGIGNGRAAAILLARAGASVLVVDRFREFAQNTVDMILKEGGEAVAHEADQLEDGALRLAVLGGRVPGGGGLGFVVDSGKPGGREVVGAAHVEADVPVRPDAPQEKADAA